MSSSKQCVICEDQGESANIRNHYGCESSCDACRHFFGDSVKKMAKSNHKFLAGKNVTRHCYNNFGCVVKGKRPCASCRFLKCIDNQMNPELSLKNAAKEVQENNPESKNKTLDDYIVELRPIYESNLAILLSAAHEARANSNSEPAVTSGPANNYEESSASVNSDARTKSSKQCVICGEDQGKKKPKNRVHFGCENSCDACQNFFGSSVKNMTKSSHRFLGGKKATRHCHKNFGCEVKGKRPCNSCRFLKCIENQMNPETPLKNAAKEVQENDPESVNKALVVYIKDLRPTFELNLAILLSAAEEARANPEIKPAMNSEAANNCEGFSRSVNSDASDASHFSQLTLSEAPPRGTYNNTPGNHPSNVSYPQQPNSFHAGHMPNDERTHNWNNQTKGNDYTDFEVSSGSSQVSVANNSQQSTYYPAVSNNPLHNPVEYNSYMPAYPVTDVPLHYDDNTISHVGSDGNTGLNSHTHDTVGQVDQFYPPSRYQSTGTYNHEVTITQLEQSTKMRKQCIQSSQLDLAVPKDIERKDTTRDWTFMSPVARSLPQLGSHGTGTLNHAVAISHFGQATPVHVGQNYTYYTPGQLVASSSTQIHAGPSEMQAQNTGPFRYTHGSMAHVDQFTPPSGNQSTGTLNQGVEITHVVQSTPLTVGQNSAWNNPQCAPSQQTNYAGQSSQINTVSNEIHVPGQSVNYAGPTTQIHAGANEMIRSKRQNPTENVNETAKRSISAEPFNRLAIKHNTAELCRILNTFGMKMDTGFKCDYDGDAPADKRCECDRSLGKPETDAVTLKKILRNTTMDGPHHFSNWMCHNGLHPDIFALENPMKELSQKSICPAGRFYQSRDMTDYFVAESKKDDGKYVELKKSELRSGVNYFICCKRKDQFYWQIYYGTDERRVAGYGPYPGYDERRYFFNKEFDQQCKGQTSSGKSMES